MNPPTNESIFLYLPGINSCECLNKQTALVPNYFQLIPDQSPVSGHQQNIG